MLCELHIEALAKRLTMGKANTRAAVHRGGQPLLD